MDDNRRRMRIMLSVTGLVCVALSLILGFVFPGTFWNWGLLLVALLFVFLSRRVG